ncbi:hypothetical protein CN918_30160 [Priestia megaterium]|nr:hypothetical protein CN918_30160 [Priestia megaterium]
MNTTKSTSTYLETILWVNRNFVSTSKYNGTTIPIVFGGMSEEGVYSVEKYNILYSPRFHVEYKIESNLLFVPVFVANKERTLIDTFEASEALKYLFELSKELQVSAISITVKNASESHDTFFCNRGFARYRKEHPNGAVSTYTFIIPEAQKMFYMIQETFSNLHFILRKADCIKKFSLSAFEISSTKLTYIFNYMNHEDYEEGITREFTLNIDKSGIYLHQEQYDIKLYINKEQFLSESVYYFFDNIIWRIQYLYEYLGKFVTIDKKHYNRIYKFLCESYKTPECISGIDRHMTIVKKFENTPYEIIYLGIEGRILIINSSDNTVTLYSPEEKDKAILHFSQLASSKYERLLMEELQSI